MVTVAEIEQHVLLVQGHVAGLRAEYENLEQLVSKAVDLGLEVGGFATALAAGAALNGDKTLAKVGGVVAVTSFAVAAYKAFKHKGERERLIAEFFAVPSKLSSRLQPLTDSLLALPDAAYPEGVVDELQSNESVMPSLWNISEAGGMPAVMYSACVERLELARRLAAFREFAEQHKRSIERALQIASTGPDENALDELLAALADATDLSAAEAGSTREVTQLLAGKANANLAREAVKITDLVSAQWFAKRSDGHQRRELLASIRSETSTSLRQFTARDARQRVERLNEVSSGAVTELTTSWWRWRNLSATGRRFWDAMLLGAVGLNLAVGVFYIEKQRGDRSWSAYLVDFFERHAGSWSAQ